MVNSTLMRRVDLRRSGRRLRCRQRAARQVKLMCATETRAYAQTVLSLRATARPRQQQRQQHHQQTASTVICYVDVCARAGRISRASRASQSIYQKYIFAIVTHAGNKLLHGTGKLAHTHTHTAKRGCHDCGSGSAHNSQVIFRHYHF